MSLIHLKQDMFEIRPSNFTVELFFLEELEIFAPEFLIEEIENNKDTIIEKSGLDEKDFNGFLSIIRLRVRIIPEEDFLEFRQDAKEICPDEKDILYFALALYLKCPVWSNEKSLKKQKHLPVYATHELVEMFRR